MAGEALNVILRIRGIKLVKAKGRTYLYHRPSGERLRASADDAAAIAAEVASINARMASKTAVPGTLGLAIKGYRESPFWAGLSYATRTSYDRVFSVLKPLDDMPLIKMRPAFVAALRDKVFAKRGRWMANYVVTVLSIVFSFARENGWMEDNPAQDIRKIPKASDARTVNRPWSKDECRAVLDAAEPYLALAIGLAMFTGMRKSDVLKLSKNAISTGTIRVRTQKRRVPVALPIHPVLLALLEAAPKTRATTVIANSRGEPWTESGFNSTFTKFIARLETKGMVAEGLTMHGLRHNLGTRLKEAGADDGTIADLLGQKTTSMARHYSSEADLTDATRAMVMGLNLTENKTGTGTEGWKTFGKLVRLQQKKTR